MIRIVLAHDTADAAWVDQLADLLRQELSGRSLAVTPEVIPSPGLASLPAVENLGPLSLMGVVLPGRPFTPNEQAAVSGFLAGCARGDVRLIPLSPEQPRDVPPAPLSGRVSKKVHTLSDPAAITQLTDFLLNLVGLRLAGGQRKVFVSYKISDGKDVAIRLAEGLRERGYEVWRDESLDRDGNPLIGPGTEAQETIDRAIQDHGFVLVVDTPQAGQSRWVHAEVETAYARMLPILPVVVEDPHLVAGGSPQMSTGGQFLILRNMQREVRVTAAAQQGKTPAQFLDDAFFDGLERAMNTVLVNHLRTRLGLLRETEQAFRRLRFGGWRELHPGHLVFEAGYDWNGPMSPRLLMRLLVQCAPYDVLQEEQVVNLAARFTSAASPCQYAVLVHPTPVNPFDKERLLRHSRGHLLLLTPQEIPQLPNLFRL